MSDPTEKQPWHVEKGISLPFVFVVLVQTSGIIAWGAVLDHRVGIMEDNITALKSQLQGAENDISSQSSSIAVIGNQITNIDRQLNRVEAQTENTYNLIRQFINDMSNGGAN